MPIPFSLSWSSVRPTLCPCCLEVLNSDNVVFNSNTAFCLLCVLPLMDGPRIDCLCLLSDAIAQDHWACFRGLYFFTPSRQPRLPVQLVRTGGPDDWLLNPDSDLCTRSDAMIAPRGPGPPPDDNPIAGGSPI